MLQAIAWYFEIFGRFGGVGMYAAWMVLCFVVLVAGLFVRGALYDLGRLLRWMWRKASSKAI